jgi:catechol 2,3-dioxygenase-like lactoylglutathione lyase family enzyme
MSIDNGFSVALDHPGFVVSDLAQATEFFTTVLNGHFVRGGEISSANGDDVVGLLGVDPDDSCRFAFIGFGDRTFELLEWTGPDRNVEIAGNSDAGGRHLAVKVDDLDAAVALVKAWPGTTLRSQSPRGFIYATLPFGLELQLMP